MKFDPIVNPSYVATIVRVEPENLYAVPGLDNLLGYTKFGMQALASKDTKPGLYILFSTEVQLSLKYAYENNLHRDALLNRVKTELGYLEDNRRVKAIQLRKNRSESLLMPLASLSYLLTDKELAKLKEGDVFDSIDGHEICRKYVIKESKPNSGTQPKPRLRRVTTKAFPEHTDTESYFRNDFKIPADAFVVVTQKLHGTSLRVGRVPVRREPRWYERALVRCGIAEFV